MGRRRRWVGDKDDSRDPGFPEGASSSPLIGRGLREEQKACFGVGEWFWPQAAQTDWLGVNPDSPTYQRW